MRSTFGPKEGKESSEEKKEEEKMSEVTLVYKGEDEVIQQVDTSIADVEITFKIWKTTTGISTR